MAEMKVNLYGNDYKITRIETEKYVNGNLAIQLMCLDEEFGGEEPFAKITVNLVDGLKENEAFVDINNCPWAIDFIESNEFGYDTGSKKASGYCTYPLYKFDLMKLEAKANG